MNLDYLRQRAELLNKTRAFFRDRGFLEVETPLACDQVIPEAPIEPARTAEGLFLQASPEMEMKRLLCAGSGPIFQIGKAFRDDEHGKLHRREFTMLEWYRPGDDMRAGMDLLDEFIQALLGTPPCVRTSYRDAFWKSCRVDPLNATRTALASAAEERGIAVEDPDSLSRNGWLNLLLSTVVEPHLVGNSPTILRHFPADQAALATTTIDALGIGVAERFELYHQGAELANGYHELTDATELRQRLEAANEMRVAAGRPALPLPEKLLKDMESPGLPPCSGVALGFDRLVMLAVGAQEIAEVIAFSQTSNE